MNYVSRLAALAAAALLSVGLSQVALAAPPAPPPQGVPAPRILVIDRAAILRGSAVGQSIMKQVQQLTINAENGLKARDAALRQEGAQLQQQLAILAPAVKKQKIAAFEAKQQALQAEVQKQQGLIQGGVLVARQQIERALGPILQKIMQERGANLLFEKAAIVVGSPNFDITPVVIQRLNQALPTVQVKPTPLPAGVQGGQ
jgi:Skp family chaperone for outer membrane proteins